MVKVRIYTRTGDSGKTSLYGGKRIAKHSKRIEAIGAIDELNALLGVVTTAVNNKKIAKLIQKIQNRLFNIGAELANPHKIGLDTNKLSQIGKLDTEELESIIDQYQESLADLKNFILPSGSDEAALFHFARAVSRRAERKIVALSNSENVNNHLLAYINRLSDLLFVLARYSNKKAGIKDIPWEK